MIWLGSASLLLAAGGIAYLLLSAAMVLRFGRTAPWTPLPAPFAGGGGLRGREGRSHAEEWTAPPGAGRGMTLLKPLHGAEPGLSENLGSCLDQDHDGPVQIILGLQSLSDPALAVAERLRAAHPGRDIEIVVDTRLHGTNRKVSNLMNMAERARHPVVVLADSDMRVPRDYLARLLAALDRPGVGAVTCLYHGLPAGRLWSRLSALAIDTHFLPSVVVGLSLGLATPCMGSTIALRRETLDRIGGFGALADTLADDYELGAAVRRLGLEVAVPPFTLGHVCAERSFRDLVTQELRWVRTIRLIDPAGHAGSAVTHPVAFALLGLVLLPGFTALSLFGAACLARIGLCLAVERAFGLNTHPYWLAPARDLMSAGIYIASFFGRDVIWRGHDYEVARTGALHPKTRLP